VCDGICRIVRSDEGDERNIMLAGQVAEHVVCAHLGAGVEWVRQDLCEEEDPGH
jgi:hypothetical protein